MEVEAIQTLNDHGGTDCCISVPTLSTLSTPEPEPQPEEQEIIQTERE